jgi:hypothetical protein
MLKIARSTALMEVDRTGREAVSVSFSTVSIESVGLKKGRRGRGRKHMFCGSYLSSGVQRCY